MQINIKQILYRTVEIEQCDKEDYDNIILKNRHYTPLDLLHMFVKYLENNNGPQHLIDECNSYYQKDIVYEVS